MAAEILTNIWLSEWSDDEPKTNGGQDIALRNLRLGVFAILGAGQGNIIYCRLYKNVQNNYIESIFAINCVLCALK